MISIMNSIVITANFIIIIHANVATIVYIIVT